MRFLGSDLYDVPSYLYTEQIGLSPDDFEEDAMAVRGPRGDITAERILCAADRLLEAHGRVEGISLRAVAAEVGVAVNALYTYFSSLDAIWHDLADERLGRLEPQNLLDRACPHCALLELSDRAVAVMSTPGTVSLLRRGPVLGRASFILSETIMALTEHGSLDPRDAHDLVVGWFYGSGVLEGEGWTSGTDAIRDADPLQDFPRIATRSQPDRHQQAEAILRGIGLTCSTARRWSSLASTKGPNP
jgi:Transcriptional regulator